MEDRRKDWIDGVMKPAMLYGAIGGVILGGLVMWIFWEAFRYWQDYVGLPILGAVLGSLLAWMVTGLAGILHYLRNQ